MGFLEDLEKGNLSILSELQLNGKSLEEAKNLIMEAGFKWRHVKEDGKAYCITMDLNPGRVNLTTENGLVVDWGIG